MKKVLLFLYLIQLCIFIKLNAQNSSALKINGLTIYNTHSHAEIIAAYGNPTEYLSGTHEDCNVKWETYSYNYSDSTDIFTFENGCFSGFSIRSPKFKINGSVGVGDDIGKLYQLQGGGTLIQKKNDNCYLYGIYLNSDIYIVILYDSNNKIKYISLDSNDI